MTRVLTIRHDMWWERWKQGGGWKCPLRHCQRGGEGTGSSNSSQPLLKGQRLPVIGARSCCLCRFGSVSAGLLALDWFTAFFSLWLIVFALLFTQVRGGLGLWWHPTRVLLGEGTYRSRSHDHHMT